MNGSGGRLSLAMCESRDRLYSQLLAVSEACGVDDVEEAREAVMEFAFADRAGRSGASPDRERSRSAASSEPRRTSAEHDSILFPCVQRARGTYVFQIAHFADE